MKIVQRIKKISIVSMILAFIFGAIFIAFPAAVMKYMSLFLGAAMIVIGAVAIINYLRERTGAFIFVSGLFFIILGIVVCTQYEMIIKFIVVMLGVFLLTSGIFNIYTAIKVIATTFMGWVTLFLSVATAVLGVIAITKATDFSEGAVVLIGVSLIVYALLELLAYIQVKTLFKDVRDTVNETAAEVRKAVDSVSDFEETFNSINSDNSIDTTGTIVEDDDEE
ncbi:MAG: DUF308 domain-containing protein [Eubacterium sp.]|nr:DUF308 domain-containing protein [Eubacterium sp.]